jgi:hypothetical protein
MIQFENAVNHFNRVILKELQSANIKCWVAGGVLRDYFMGIPMKTDYDLFFPDQIEYEKTAMYFRVKNAVIVWESENGMKVEYSGRVYDLVKKFFPTPVDTINNFDFTVCMFAVDGKEIYHGETTFIDLAKRQLIINNLNYPASTMRRAFRYYKKGFTMCVGEMKKLAEAIQGTPIESKPPENNNNERESSGEAMRFFRGID